MGTITQHDGIALRILTLGSEPHPHTITADPCTNSYVCECIPCQLEREQRVKNGVRRQHPMPVRRAA